MAKFIQFMTKESLYDGPFDSKSGWAAAGMGDVIVTKNGNLIVIDGGMPSNAEEFLQLLQAHSSGSVITVDLWIITHPHLDHYGVIQEISRTEALKNRICVKEIIYWFPDEFCGKDGKTNALLKENANMTDICRLMSAKNHRPTRDETVTVDGIDVTFLYVPDDCSILNTADGNSNHCSLIFMVRGDDKSVLVTGDAYGRSMQITAWRYADLLKCDILQMPHHALCDAFCTDFYRHADPQTILMPISAAGYRSMHSKLYDTHAGCIVNLCLEAKAQNVYKAFDGTAELLI